jgi:hypothetical protein
MIRLAQLKDSCQVQDGVGRDKEAEPAYEVALADGDQAASIQSVLSVMSVHISPTGLEPVCRRLRLAPSPRRFTQRSIIAVNNNGVDVLRRKTALCAQAKTCQGITQRPTHVTKTQESPQKRRTQQKAPEVGRIMVHSWLGPYLVPHEHAHDAMLARIGRGQMAVTKETYTSPALSRSKAFRIHSRLPCCPPPSSDLELTYISCPRYTS